MASITRCKGGWRAQVYVRGARDSKVCRTRQEATAWGVRREQELANSGGGEILFRVATERFLKWKLPKLDNADNQRVYEQSLRDHALPEIGENKLNELTRRKLVAMVQKIAAKGKVETASRVGQRVCSILDFMVDEGEIESHAAAGLSRVLPAKKTRNLPAVTPPEIPKLMRDICGYAEPVTRIGMKLLAHTFVRTTELVGARWSELKGDYWVIPEERMKGKAENRKPHVVPISRQVRAMLDDLAAITGDGEYWLASPYDSRVPISSNTMLFGLYRLGYKGKMSGHGFRSVASTVLNESGLWNPDAIEKQLAHKETDQVRASYLRALYLEERVRMMQAWSDYLEASTLRTSE